METVEFDANVSYSIDDCGGILWSVGNNGNLFRFMHSIPSEAQITYDELYTIIRPIFSN